MHDRFHQYSHNVAQYVRHATGKEKAALRKELNDHMEDHAQALLDGGFPEEHAYRVAVESMGDPETVGKALNKEYPLRWLILSRLVWLAVLVAALLLVLALAHGLKGATGSLEARQAPREHHPAEVQLPDAELIPLDFTQTFPNGDAIRFYAAAVELDENYKDRGYVGHLYAVSYNKNPLRDPLHYSYIIDTLPPSQEETLLVSLEGNNHGNAQYHHWILYTLQPEENVMVQYDRFGTSFTLEVPMPWEEVSVP